MHAAAALVVVQLLVDRRRRLAREVGVLRIGRDALLAVAGHAALSNLGTRLASADPEPA